MLPNPKIVLSDMIQDYMRRHKYISKLSLAEQTQVPLHILQKIIDRNVDSVEFELAYRILSVIMPDGTKDILSNLYPSHRSRIASDADPAASLKKVNDSLKIALKNRLSYTLHSMASCHCGTTEDEVNNTFGADGVRLLRKMIHLGILNEMDDGKIYDPFVDSLQSDLSQAAQMIRYNSDNFDPATDMSIIFNMVEGFNEDGLYKVRDVYRRTLAELLEFVKDPQLWGENRIFMSGLIGFVKPKISPSNIKKNSNSSDIEIAEKIADIVHDIRKPLKDVLDFINGSSHLSSAAVERAQSAGKRLDRMIRSLKDTNDDFVLRRMDTLYLDPILNLSQTLSNDSGKEFEFHGEKVFQGYLDSEKTERLLQNLLINAFDAARSTVSLKVNRQQDALEFIVSDDGPGVPHDLVPNLFTRGFTHGKSDGTGLGLYIAQDIAEAHEGGIKYEHSGSHTIFTVMLGGVFVVAKLDGAHTSNQPLNNTSAEQTHEKPLLFFRAIIPDVHLARRNQIAQMLSEYQLSEDYNDLPRVWLACTDDIALALQASEVGVQRVWTPPSNAIQHQEFMEALRDLALTELENFKLHGKNK